MSLVVRRGLQLGVSMMPTLTKINQVLNTLRCKRALLGGELANMDLFLDFAPHCSRTEGCHVDDSLTRCGVSLSQPNPFGWKSCGMGGLVAYVLDLAHTLRREARLWVCRVRVAWDIRRRFFDRLAVGSPSESMRLLSRGAHFSERADHP